MRNCNPLSFILQFATSTWTSTWLFNFTRKQFRQHITTRNEIGNDQIFLFLAKHNQCIIVFYFWESQYSRNSHSHGPFLTCIKKGKIFITRGLSLELTNIYIYMKITKAVLTNSSSIFKIIVLLLKLIRGSFSHDLYVLPYYSRAQLVWEWGGVIVVILPLFLSTFCKLTLLYTLYRTFNYIQEKVKLNVFIKKVMCELLLPSK